MPFGEPDRHPGQRQRQQHGQQRQAAGKRRLAARRGQAPPLADLLAGDRGSRLAADLRPVDRQPGQPRMFSARPSLPVGSRHEAHLITAHWPAIAAKCRDMQEDFRAAGLRADEAEALVVVPAADDPVAFHGGLLRAIQCWAVLQSIRWNCQVARIITPKAMRYQAKAA
ncbi:hypothetical protein D9M71_562180 [compost metagenome]